MRVELSQERQITPRTVLKTVLPSLGAAILTISAFCSSGCGTKSDYPVHLAFPSRTDRLVLKVPDTTPPESSGRTEADLAQLDERGGKTAIPNTIPQDRLDAVDQFLRDAFGTPAAPGIKVNGDEQARSSAEGLGLSGEALTEAAKAFRNHCQSCHGLPGDGRGPAGLYVSPYPRDYRRGAFKFSTTGEGQKPCRSDLVRTITEGVKGTPMPSFSLLAEDQRDLLARYVTYLAIRGQVEFELLAAQISGSGEDLAVHGAQRLKDLLTEWQKAEHAPAVPPVPDDGEWESEKNQAAVRRGYELFVAKTGTECLKCHGDFGRKPVPRYDVWGTVARPANFTESTLKGGIRPEDVFARIRWGIAPVGMPAHPTLTDRQIWDLVRFVRSAPFPRELPKDIRAMVYPSP